MTIVAGLCVAAAVSTLGYWRVHMAASIDSECVKALQAISSGKLDEWRGLPAACRRQDAEAVFGASGSDPDGVATLGDAPTAFRDYPPNQVARQGITVWLAGDKILSLQVNSPALPVALERVLGRPQAVAASHLKAFHEQWIYADRGITAHVDADSHSVLRIYFYAPTTPDAFLASSLSRVETRRTPRK